MTTSSPDQGLEISTAELAQRLQGHNPPTLAEILGPEHFASGHLPGAINLPLEGFAALAQRTLPDKTAAIVVYCASATCANSHLAQQKLLALGYRDVRAYKGGKAAWRDAGLSLERSTETSVATASA
jgi:rhodanese-related sulfurtransferase